MRMAKRPLLLIEVMVALLICASVLAAILVPYRTMCARAGANFEAAKEQFLYDEVLFRVVEARMRGAVPSTLVVGGKTFTVEEKGERKVKVSREGVSWDIVVVAKAP